MRSVKSARSSPSRFFSPVCAGESHMSHRWVHCRPRSAQRAARSGGAVGGSSFLPGQRAQVIVANHGAYMQVPVGLGLYYTAQFSCLQRPVPKTPNSDTFNG